jgi:hypothetical protein
MAWVLGSEKEFEPAGQPSNRLPAEANCRSTLLAEICVVDTSVCQNLSGSYWQLARIQAQRNLGVATEIQKYLEL